MMTTNRKKYDLFCLRGVCLILIFWFSSVAFADSTIRVTWLPNSEADLGGYYLYYGTSSGNYGPPVPIPANSTSYNITGLIEGTRYYVALSAYDLSNNESERCPEINGIAPTTTTSSSSSTTTSIISDQYDFCSAEVPLTLTGITPEEGTIHINLTDDPGFADSALLIITLFDPDLSGEGYFYINDNGPFDLPVGNYNDLVKTFEIPINPDFLVPGDNSFRFTHVETWGYEVRELCLNLAELSSTSSTTVPGIATIIPQPAGSSLTGSIIINNDDFVTHARVVTLTLYAAVNESLVANTSSLFLGEKELGSEAVMCFSNDEQNWSSLEPYKQTKQWTLEPGNGLKTVYARFRDGEGNWIDQYVHDQITLEELQNFCNEITKLRPISVTASSASPFYSKENLIDGDPSTIWSSVVSLFKRNEYITLDFGTSKKIVELSMYASRMFGVDFFPTNFKIQVSQDNITWIDVSNEQGYVFGQTLSSDSWNTNGCECRYLRIYITNSKTLFLFFHIAQIAEIEVYGCDNSDQPSQLLPGEGTSFVDSMVKEANIPNKTADRTIIDLFTRTPSTPGKPEITFHH